MFNYYLFHEDVEDTSLLDETLGILKEHGKYENDIKYVRVKNIKTTDLSSFYAYVDWNSFKEAIKDYKYNRGYGVQYVWEDLRVVLYDGDYLERHEYDGSEWWVYVAKPPMDVLITKYDPEEMEFTEWQPIS